MNQNLTRLLRVTPLCLFMFQLNAQKSVLTSGGSVSGAGGSVSYSVGQIDYFIVSNANGSSSEGVQQPLVASILPVTLLSFNATKFGSKVLLDWETVTEINSSRFVVQRSVDGVGFSRLKEIPASGNSTILRKYSMEDLQPAKGVNFYRVQMVDKDGSLTYTKIKSIHFGGAANLGITLYPNPARRTVFLRVNDITDKKYTYNLLTTAGALVKQNLISDVETSIEIEKIPSGAYFLVIKDQNNTTVKSFKINKTN